MSTTPPPNESYEFTEEQNEVIGSLAWDMQFVGIVLLIAGALQIVAGLVLLAQGGFTALLQGACALVLGGFTIKAAGAFRRIVETKGNDIGHLMSALGTLRGLYRLQVILLVIVLVLLVVVFCLVGVSGLTRR